MITQEKYDKAVEVLKELKHLCNNANCDYCPFNIPYVLTSNSSCCVPTSCLLLIQAPHDIQIEDLQKPQPPIEPIGLFTPQDAEFVKMLLKNQPLTRQITFYIKNCHIPKDEIHLHWHSQKQEQFVLVGVDSSFFSNMLQGTYELTVDMIQKEIAKVKSQQTSCQS